MNDKLKENNSFVTGITFKQKLNIGLVLSILLVAFITFLSSYYTNKLINSAARIEHTVTVLNEAGQTLLLANDIENGQRGYLITMDSSFLQYFTIAKSSIYDHLKNLKELTKGNLHQQARTDPLKELIDKRINFSLKSIQLSHDSGFNAASRNVATGIGKTLTDKIRKLIADIQQEENRLLVSQHAENEKNNADFNYALYSLFGSIIILLLAVFFTVRHNLAAKVKAEERLLQSIREIADYKYALDESSIVAITNEEGIIKYANDNFCRISKFSRKELIGKDHRVINSGYHSKEFMEGLWVAIADGKIWRGEIKNKAKDNDTYWVDTTIVPFLNDLKKPYQYITISTDITTRKKLEEQQALFASIVTSSHDAIISKTLDGIITSWNPGAEKVFGYTAGEIIGKSIYILIPAHLQKEESEIIEKIRKGEVVDHYETERIRKDGKIISVSLTISPIKDSLGKITGASKVSRDVTALKEAEKIQHELEEKVKVTTKELAGIFERISDGFIMLDKNFCYTYANKKVGEMVNHDPSFLLGKQVWQVFPDAVGSQTYHAFKKAMSEQKYVYNIDYYEPLDIWQENHVYPSGDGINVFIRDITEQKRAEQKIIKSERIYKTIASSIPGSVLCVIDRDYKYVLIEGDFLAKIGYTKEQLTGNRLQDILTPERYDAIAKSLDKVFAGEALTTEESRGEYYTTTEFVPLKDENNYVYAAMIVVLDVTQLKKAELHILQLNVGLEQKVAERTAQLKALNKELEFNILKVRESEEKFSKIFETSPVGISIGALETGVIMDANKSFLHITGYTYEEVIGNSPLELKMIDEGEREKIKHELHEYAKVRDKEIVVSNKSGKSFPVLLSIDQFTIKDDRYAITIVYDISERKKAEDQLMAANKELEAFTYSVSHDLRAPLRAVSGYAAMLEEDYDKSLDAEGKRLLAEVKGNAKKMGTLIDDLLAFSRLGRKEISKTHVNMNDLTASAIKEVEQTSVNGLRIKLNNLSSVVGDYSLLLQVMINLVSNAVKYSSKSAEPHVEIDSNKRNGELIFSISDNGVGFDMKYAHKLFGVFQRLHSAGEFPGTGVGLAIVQRIIHKHQGKVWAEGEIGKGATFFFSLPESIKIDFTKN